MLISDWSSDVCSSDLMSKTTLSNQTRQASDGQYQAALRLTRPEMAHIEPRTTHVDVQTYLDDSVFKREQLALFRRLPVPAAVSQDLPKPGTFMSVEVAGVPVILTRPKSGPVKAFLNTCRSEEHTSELQSLMRISYAVFCLKKKKKT